MIDIRHRVAGVVVHTQCDLGIPHLLRRPFQSFVADGEAAHITCHIRQMPETTSPCLPLTASQQDALLRMVGFPQQWLGQPALQNPAVREQLDQCLDQPDFVELALRWGRAIFFDHAKSELHYYYPSSWAKNISSLWMVAAYRNLLAPFWPNFSAVNVHAAGLLRRGKAAIFLAPDEGGKTTLVNLCPERGGVLSDDHVVLRLAANRVQANGTPFGRVTDGEISADLSAIFLLEKASEFSLCPVAPNEVLSYLMDEHSRLFISLPKARRVRALEVLAAACSQAATFRLRFPRDFVDWRAVDEAVEAGRTGQAAARSGLESLGNDSKAAGVVAFCRYVTRLQHPP